MTKTDIKREKYLWKKYGVTLKWYTSKLEEQGGRCAICGSLPVTRSLPVDHDHKRAKIKPKVKRSEQEWTYKLDKWNVTIPELNYNKEWLGSSKAEVRAAVLSIIKGKSARGVICFGCNTGIRKFRDNASYLRKAAEYLEKYQEKLCQNK